MTELQSSLLEMFKWFHALCQKNHLCYYVLGGTMLGAVRHKGFIPWDDDVDIGMPRDDYDKLFSVINSNPNGRYVMETPNTEAKDYYYPYAKIYDTQTTLIENTRLKIKRGIYLDIFPLDGIGNDRKESLKNYREIQWKYNLLLTRVTGVRTGRIWYKNLAVKIAQKIPECVLKNKRILLNLDRTCRKYDFDKCVWVGNLVGAWRFKEVMPREIFGEPTIYQFESMEAYGAQDANGYLTYLYGDWKKLPPKEKQVSHHDFLELNLNKSYLDK